MQLCIGLLIWLLGCVAPCVGLCLWARHRRTGSIKPAPRVAEQTYGHPRSPAKELRKRLPELPGGYLWETRVEARGSGHYYLCVTLVDITKGTNVAGAEQDLTYCSRHGDAHAACYLRYKAISETLFIDGVIAPLVGWASSEAAKLHAGEVYDYHLGTDS